LVPKVGVVTINSGVALFLTLTQARARTHTHTHTHTHTQTHTHTWYIPEGIEPGVLAGSLGCDGFQAQRVTSAICATPSLAVWMHRKKRQGVRLRRQAKNRTGWHTRWHTDWHTKVHSTISPLCESNVEKGHGVKSNSFGSRVRAALFRNA